MLTYIIYGFYGSDFIIADAMQDIDEGIELDYKDPEKYYKLGEIYYSGDRTHNIREIEDKILGVDHNYLNDNMGFTKQIKSYVMPITEEQKQLFIEKIKINSNTAIEIFKEKAKEYKTVPVSEKNNKLNELLSIVEEQEENKKTYYDILSNVIEEDKNKIENIARKTGKKQLLSTRFVACNSRTEDCIMDIISEYIYPDGTFQEVREHCY